MELRDVMAALRTRWWLMVLVPLLAAGAAFGISLLITPEYRSSTQLYLSATGTRQPDRSLQDIVVPPDRVASYAELVGGPDLAGRIITVLDLPLTPKELQDELTVRAVPGTVLIDVTVTDRSPARAFRIAQAVGSEFPRLVGQLETAGGTAAPVRVTVAEQPRRPDRPSSPQVERNVVIAAAFGLLLGAVAALLRFVLDRRLREPAQIAALAGAPVIGGVSRDRRLRRPAHHGDGHAGVEFHRIRALLQCLDVGESSVLLVSSCLGREGKTTLALNLGLALADADRTVTVVEADLTSPSMARVAGIPETPGLAHVLADDADLDDAIHPHPRADVSLVPAGTQPPDLPATLHAGPLFSILEKLRGRSDVVVVDGPPLLTDPEATRIAAHADGVLLTVRYRRTRAHQLQQAVEMLEFARADVLGVVLTGMPRRAATTARFGFPDIGRHTPGRNPPWHGGLSG